MGHRREYFLSTSFRRQTWEYISFFINCSCMFFFIYKNDPLMKLKACVTLSQNYNQIWPSFRHQMVRSRACSLRRCGHWRRKSCPILPSRRHSMFRTTCKPHALPSFPYKGTCSHVGSSLIDPSLVHEPRLTDSISRQLASLDRFPLWVR
jgi:hypothetical protein